MKRDLDSHTSSRSLTHPAGNLNNKPAARNDHTTQPETEPALNRFALKPLVLGLDPCEALVSFAAIGAAPAEVFASRGWSTAEWSAARDRLTGRGWIDAEGNASERGRQGRDEIEWRTDRLADAPWRALGADRAQRLAELTGPLLGTAFESGLLPAQSTLGIATVHAPAPRP
jgi:hypothetical protein